jgi:hypothetical protein
MPVVIDQKILGQLPEALRNELVSAYSEVVKNYRERRWEPSELNGGKLCEVVYTILRGHIKGQFPEKSAKPSNMVEACRALEQASSAKFSRSVRIQIPRMLLALYEVRNNRGVGHAGGDVDPNHMDATCVLQISKWIVAELVRLFHNVDTRTAAAAVDSIVERVIPIVWEIDGKLRIIDTELTMMEKTLVLLYHQSEGVTEAKLLEWVEHSNPSIFRRDVLRKAHREKLIEYNTSNVQISPKGISYVEEIVLVKKSR